MIRRPPSSPLFPSTPLFRSVRLRRQVVDVVHAVLDVAAEDLACRREAGVGLGDEVDGHDGCAALLQLEGEVAVGRADVERALAAEIARQSEGVEDGELHPVRVVAGRQDAGGELDLVPPAAMLGDQAPDLIGGHQWAREKSMKPRSTLTSTSFTWTRLPMSRPCAPCTTFPSTGGWKIRTHVPLSEAPVTMPSNFSPMRFLSTYAAADLRTCCSTLFAASSAFVQWSASAPSSAASYGGCAPASAAFTRRCAMRSGKRRFGAVECV